LDRNEKGGNPRSAPNQQPPQPMPEKKPDGFMSRILGGLRKKKE
jgi:hypothetical protein